MKNAKKLLALLLALVMCVGLLAGCNNNPATSDPGTDGSAAPSESGGGNANETTPLVVATEQGLEGKFSPFFYLSNADNEVVSLTQISLLTVDRVGNPVLNGIEGETREYNGTDYTYYGPADIVIDEDPEGEPDGTVYYDITMRDDLVFSDGEPATIDDVIFGIYVYLDPTYDGNSTMRSLPIEGLDAYLQNNITLSAYLAQLGEDNTDFTLVTEEQQTAFWAAVNDGLVAFTQEIVDYVRTATENPEMSVAEAAANWNFSGLAEDATVKDFALAIGDNYEWSFSAMEAESAGSALSDLIPEDVYAYSTTNVQVGDSAANISGIERTGDYSMTVHMTQIDATALLQFTLAVAPMHYYGEESLYDYENNMFGFNKGDLEHVRSVTSTPMGAGPYTFDSYENGVVSTTANPLYWKGEPKIAHINVQFTLEQDKVTGVESGTLDIATPAFSTDTIKEINDINGSEDFDGDVITIRTTQYLGYGYIGINADNVSVGDDPGSEQSKDLRKALATVLSVYRDVVIDSYYGEYATVINYPISDTSWAAPKVTDEGYQVAFSVDVDGNPIYTEGMSEEERYAAALDAALGFLEAAGYTITDGVATAAPAGASLEYEVLVPGGGVGDHPNFMILTMASEALATIGIDLIVTDVTDGTVTIGNNLDAGIAELWTMAWSATPDPDMTQIYFADVANGGANAGGSSNYYGIKDETLDGLIVDARASLDQNYRKVLYKQCLDIIADWACEIPCYQRTDSTIFSTERVNTSTITPDMTPYWGWNAEIERLELN